LLLLKYNFYWEISNSQAISFCTPQSIFHHLLEFWALSQVERWSGELGN